MGAQATLAGTHQETLDDLLGHSVRGDQRHSHELSSEPVWQQSSSSQPFRHVSSNDVALSSAPPFHGSSSTAFGTSYMPRSIGGALSSSLVFIDTLPVGTSIFHESCSLPGSALRALAGRQISRMPTPRFESAQGVWQVPNMLRMGTRPESPQELWQAPFSSRSALQEPPTDTDVFLTGSERAPATLENPHTSVLAQCRAERLRAEAERRRAEEEHRQAKSERLRAKAERLWAEAERLDMQRKVDEEAETREEEHPAMCTDIVPLTQASAEHHSALQACHNTAERIPEHYEWVCRQLRKHELRQKRLKAQLHHERQSRAAEHETLQRILEGQVNLQEIENRLQKLRTQSTEVLKSDRRVNLDEHFEWNDVDTCSESDDHLSESEQHQDSARFDKELGSPTGSLANDSFYATSNASEGGSHASVNG